MADLIGVQISGLTTAPTLTDTTYVPLQRQGIDKAEKMSLSNLSSYLVNSTLFSNYIESSVNSKIQIHIGGNDPHGDRAYTNTVLQSHITATDPHGDRAYANTKIATDITAHKTAIDPHGDRVYSDTILANHKNAVDPHGDRAYTDGKAVDTLTTSKNYTDNEINLKVTTKIGTTIAPLVNGKVPVTYLTKELSFSTLATFPTTGDSNILYIDSTNDDIYRWTGTAYKNLTPNVDIGGLNLTTDNVEEGSNVNRKYLTQALKTAYDAKVSKVVNKVELLDKNNLVDSTVNTEVFIKNIRGESNIDTVSMPGTVILTDNYYVYDNETTGTETVALSYKQESKTDILTRMSDFIVYNITGDLTCLSYSLSEDTKYVKDFEKIEVDLCIGMKGVLEVLPVPTNVVINNEGTIVTGKGIANKQIKIFNKSFVEINTTNTLANGDFTASLTTPITDGSPIYVYNIDGVYRSKSTKIYSKNTTNVRDVSLLSVDNTGLILKGRAEKNSTITVYKEGDIEIGTGTTVDGFFEITFTEATTEGQMVHIKTVTDLAAEKTTEYLITLSDILGAYEVVVNKERTFISGKAEPDSTVKIMDSNNDILTIDVETDGTFESEIEIPTSLTSIFLRTTKDTETYDNVLILDTYEDETNEPKENYKVISSEFGLINTKITRLNNKTNYVLTVDDTDGLITFNVNNTTSESTKWNLKIKVDQVEL